MHFKNINNSSQQSPVLNWLQQIQKKSHLEITQIPFSASKEWQIINDALMHQSERFFQVTGVAWTEGHGIPFLQPMLIQREVGILGFIFAENKILLQAKTEPGNVNGTQIAPTVQATASNLDRVHGGTKPQYADFFVDPQFSILNNSLQSEQGSRFYHKFNQNMLISIDRIFPTDDLFLWIEIEQLFDLIEEDFLINTDARSVLISSPWETLVDREPFTRYQDSFSQALNQSYRDESSITPIKEEILALRKACQPPELKGLSDIKDWRITEFAITPKSKEPYEIIQISVKAEDREVTRWDQPILTSFGEGFVALVCGWMGGRLHFLFRYQVEPGLENLIEIGPSVMVEPGENRDLTPMLNYGKTKIISEFKQSDEGGRFFKDISQYQLIDIGEIVENEPDGKWLTLGQIQKLLNEGGWFTNEARSVLSLLLKWI